MTRPYYKPTDDRKLVFDAHQVILRPLVTEKGMSASEKHNQYAFEVAPHATKTDIRDAVEKLFDVKVDSVKTQTRKGKARRYKFRNGMTRNWKKAIVSLGPEHRIDFY
ncbi:MAG: 50S ribosomal protein L23 [Pirellulaceae bacterium]